MGDVQDLSLAESSTESTSDGTPLSIPSHHPDSSLLPSSFSLYSTNLPPFPPIPKILPESKQSKHPKSNRVLSIDYGAPSDVTSRVIRSSKPLTRSQSSNGTRLGVDSDSYRLHDDVDDSALSFQQLEQATLFADVSHYNSFLPTSSAPRSPSRYPRREKSQQQCKSIDLGSSLMQASLRRLRRSPSLWTTSDRSLSINDTHDRHIHNLRAESQLSDQQKLVALRRARKIAQVFGSEAPVDVVHGTGYLHRHSIDSRDSLSTVVSVDLPSSSSTRRRSNSDSSAFHVQTNQSSSTSLDRSKTPSDMVLDIEETSSSVFPTSSFSERRRRAAKLTHFFGVNYQDISQSITQKLSPPTPQQASFGTDSKNPEVEVDVKVVGRRFWGLSDGDMKTTGVADVIGKLRGLRAG